MRKSIRRNYRAGTVGKWLRPVAVVALLIAAILIIPKWAFAPPRRPSSMRPLVDIGAGVDVGAFTPELLIATVASASAAETGSPARTRTPAASASAAASAAAAPPAAVAPSAAAYPIADSTGRKTHFIPWKLLPGDRVINSAVLKTKTHPVGKPPLYAPRETAIVTMAAGDHAAMLAIVLVQSLRDVGTSPNHDIVVLVVRGAATTRACTDAAWRAANGRTHIKCPGPDTIAEELIPEPFIKTLLRLGAIVKVIDPIPSTQYTSGIAGGRSTFWGMSLNRMVIWNMTEYKKIVWMDSDTIVVKNVDGLFNYPTFTSSITHACCSNNGPGLPSGGVWVLEPNLEFGIFFWNLMMEGWLEYNNDGTPQLTTSGRHEHATWRQSDMMLVRHAFATWDRDRSKFDQLWPKIFDDRNGYPEGLRDLPLYRVMTDAQFDKAIEDKFTQKPMHMGLDESKWDGSSIIWHTLPIHYDQCVPNCDCLPWRTNLSMAYSFHFTCFPGDTVNKPSNYDSEEALMSAVNGRRGTNCLRYFYRDLWYGTFKRAHGRFPAPYWDDTDPRTKPTNMSALLNPPTWVYEPDYETLYRITGWGRRRR